MNLGSPRKEAGKTLSWVSPLKRNPPPLLARCGEFRGKRVQASPEFKKGRIGVQHDAKFSMQNDKGKKMCQGMRTARRPLR